VERSNRGRRVCIVLIVVIVLLVRVSHSSSLEIGVFLFILTNSCDPRPSHLVASFSVAAGFIFRDAEELEQRVMMTELK
jgi:hypothetical protein